MPDSADITAARIPVPAIAVGKSPASADFSFRAACHMCACRLRINAAATYEASITVDSSGKALVGGDAEASLTVGMDEYIVLKKSINRIQAAESGEGPAAFVHLFAVTADGKLTLSYANDATILFVGSLQDSAMKHTRQVSITMSGAYAKLNTYLSGAYVNTAKRMLVTTLRSRGSIQELERALTPGLFRASSGGALALALLNQASASALNPHSSVKERIAFALEMLTYVMSSSDANYMNCKPDELYRRGIRNYMPYIDGKACLLYPDGNVDRGYSDAYNEALFTGLFRRVSGGAPILDAVLQTVTSDMMMDVSPVKRDEESGNPSDAVTKLDMIIPDSYTDMAYSRLASRYIPSAFSIEDNTNSAAVGSIPDVFIVTFTVKASWDRGKQREQGTVRAWQGTTYYGVYCRDESLLQELMQTRDKVIDKAKEKSLDQWLRVKVAEAPEFICRQLNWDSLNCTDMDECIRRRIEVLDNTARAMYIRTYRNACTLVVSVRPDAFGKADAFRDGRATTPFERHIGDMYLIRQGSYPQGDGESAEYSYSAVMGDGNLYSVGRLISVDYEYNSGVRSSAGLRLTFDQAVTDLTLDEIPDLFSAGDRNPLYI